MAKDPAFLFYYQDFLVGTTFMTFEERGAYITLLCYLADKGSLLVSDVIKVIPEVIWEAISSKFVVENNLVSHKRLSEEVEKRRKYSESRKNNLKGINQHTKKRSYDQNMTSHMENENENENVNKLNTLESNFNILWQKYPNKVDRARAFKAYTTKCKSKKSQEEILLALEKYKIHLDGNDWKRAKNGATFINNYQDWLDFTEPEVKDDNSFDRIIESNLSKIATDKMILKVMGEIPKSKWNRIESFLKKTYKQGGTPFCQLEAKFYEENGV